MTLSPAPVVSVLDDPAALAAVARDWDACVLAAGADIFFTSDWVQTWWAHFGGGRRFRALLCHEDGRLQAVLPMAVETLWAGLLPVRVARLAGADTSYAALRFPVPTDPARAEAAFAAFLAHLAGSEVALVISLSPVSAACPDLAPLLAAAATVGLEPGAQGRPRNHVMMRLPATVETWWAELSRSRQKEHQRSLKKMAGRWQLEHRASAPPTAGLDFDRFAALHAAQWQATGRGGHYGDWPGSQAYYRDLVTRLAPQGRALVEEHLGSGMVLSSRLTFRLGETAWWRLTARSLDAEAARMGAARVGMVERIERLIAAGVRVVELGAGDYDYKQAYGGELVVLHRVALLPRRGAGRIAARALLAWADLVDLVYYRLWFVKLAPRLQQKLGLRPRPLWRHWIRTRL